MSDQFGLSRYLPDRAPTWTEVVIGAFIALSIVPSFLPPSRPALPAAIIGFLAFAIALGPGARSSLGARIGRWFRDIGATGRLAVILGFAAAVAVVGVSGAVPMAPLRDAATGGLAAVLLYLTAHLVAAKEISGWIANRDGS